MDKIRGFILGGDDYIVKSATPEEVLARIKARTGKQKYTKVMIGLYE